MNRYNKSNPLRCFFAFEEYNSQGLALDRMKKYDPTFEWVCVGRSEIDKYAIIAANSLFPESTDKNYGDISKIDWTKVPDFDLFTYSFPCTNISVAGRQEGLAKGSGTSSSLLWECQKAIEIKKPKYLLMENVKALISKKFKPFFLEWDAYLRGLGYSCFSSVLDAKNYGIPQHRERVFMISILDENASYSFPEPIPLQKRLKDVLENSVDEKYYLSNVCINRLSKNLGGGKIEADVNQSAKTILSNCFKLQTFDNYIKENG